MTSVAAPSPSVAIGGPPDHQPEEIVETDEPPAPIEAIDEFLDPDPILQRWFWRTSVIDPSFTGRTPKTVYIYPGHHVDGEWSFTDLLVFLNELPPSWKHSGRLRRVVDPAGESWEVVLTITREDIDPAPKIYIHVPLHRTGLIMVAASRDVFNDDWTTYNVIHDDEYLGECRVLEMRASRWSTKWIMRSERPEENVHPVLVWFIRNFSTVSIAASKQRHAYIHQLLEALEPKPAAVSPMEEFCTSGRLKFILEPRRDGGKLEPWVYQGITYSIAAGVYIFPWALYVLRHPDLTKIAGLMFDTTWEVMWAYVTSILVVVRQNTVFPVAFAFGAAETQELYELFYDEFAALGVDLSTFITESDQGPALMALFKKHGNLYLICLHHFLRSLKDRRFAVYVSGLVKARTEGEFNLLRERFVRPLLKVIGEYTRNPAVIRAALKKEFAKAGLVFDGRAITVGASPEESARWNCVSMVKRAETEMPPTTGALESSHGHLNEDTGRYNSFWPSMCRLKRQGERSFGSWSSRVQRNLNAAYRRSDGQLRWLADVIMDQVRFFGASSAGCSCGQTAHLSKMFGTNVPCPHQLYCMQKDPNHRGPYRPKLPEVPKIEWEEYMMEGFELECEVRAGQPRAHAHTSRDYLKEKAVEQIRPFSKAKKKTIVPWVEAEFPLDLGSEFALGMPLRVVDLILEGVHKFTAHV
jgi:hypothetical protein